MHILKTTLLCGAWRRLCPADWPPGFHTSAFGSTSQYQVTRRKRTSPSSAHSNVHLSIFTSFRVFAVLRGCTHKPIGGGVTSGRCFILPQMFTAYTPSHSRPHKSAAVAGGGAKGPWSLCGPGPVSRGTAVDQISQARRPSVAIRAPACRPKGSAERAAEEMKNEILLLCSLFFLLHLSSISCYYYYTIYLSLSLSPPLPGVAVPAVLPFLSSLHTVHPLLWTLFKHSCWLAAGSACNLF